MLVGVHGRNDHQYHGRDYDLIREAKIESIKMMSFTLPVSFSQLRDNFPNLLIITRLYDDRMGIGYHPAPAEFADKMIPIMQQLRPYTNMFEVHNEPNHVAGIEGWGQEDSHAVGFNSWFLGVYDQLRQACPWASLGFPGLAIPHRDLEWITICQEAVNHADWLGVHCYWQNPTTNDANHMSDFWGLRFKHYHGKFPNKDIHVTEFGNSNTQSGLPVDHERIAKEYVAYYGELYEYPYLKSANAFIMSAPQREWGDFCWRDESGRFRPVVAAVGNMPRVEPTPVEPPPEPTPEPKEVKNMIVFERLRLAINLDNVATFQLLDDGRGRVILNVAGFLRDESGDYLVGDSIVYLPPDEAQEMWGLLK